MSAADPTHYKGYVPAMSQLEWNGKELAILPALGSSGMFELKGKPSLVREFKFFQGKVITGAWAPESHTVALANRIVVGDQGGQVLIIDAKKGTRRGGYNLSGPAKFVQAVAVHAKKDAVVSGGMDNTIALYTESDDPSEPFLHNRKQWAGEGEFGHDGMIASLKWHPLEENQFISAGGDGEVKLWDTASSSCITTYYGHSSEATSITFPRDVPGGSVFATCSNDTTVKLWDLRT